MKVTLKVKTLALVTALIVVVASVLTFAHTRRQQATLTRDLERLTETLAHNLAFNSEYGVLVGDRQGLQDLVDGVLREPDVTYLGVFDRDLRELAAGTQGDSGTVAKAAYHPSLSINSVARYLNTPGGRVYLVQYPVTLMRRQRWSEEGMLFANPMEGGQDLIGVIVVGLSTRSLTVALRQVQHTTFLLTACLALAMWSLSYFLVNLLTRPLTQLKVATEQVAAGNLDVRLRNRSKDEVGDLTRSFNQMVEEIRSSRNRIEEYTKQLEATAKELASLNQEMEDLLRVASHDLRAPLINIQGFTKRLEPIMAETLKVMDQIAAQSPEDGLKIQVESLRQQVASRFGESLRFIAKGVEKMDALLTSLLAVSRVARKADPLQTNNLTEVLDDVLTVFDHQLKDRAIDVIRHPLPASVPCRRNEINQVFSNLVSNAINYMGPTGRRFIEIGATERDDEVECFVRDTGIGISQEDQERIFHMFTRLHAVDVPGEGVGLAYVKKILRSHRGKIWVVSQKGQGSTFFFTLPTRLPPAMPGAFSAVSQASGEWQTQPMTQRG